MSLDHRERLVRLARTYDALLITDDVYDFLQWSATPGGELTAPDRACMPRLVDVDRYLDGGPVDEWGHAISNGSFSKLLGPGARTGWVESSEKVAYGASQVYVYIQSLSSSCSLFPLQNDAYPTVYVHELTCDIYYTLEDPLAPVVAPATYVPP